MLRYMQVVLVVRAQARRRLGGLGHNNGPFNSKSNILEQHTTGFADAPATCLLATSSSTLSVDALTEYHAVVISLPREFQCLSWSNTYINDELCFSI